IRTLITHPRYAILEPLYYNRTVEHPGKSARRDALPCVCTGDMWSRDSLAHCSKCGGAPVQATITVKGKVIGQSRPPFADWSIPFPPDLRASGDSITLRDLITRIVHEEVEAFRARQEERRLTRILSQAQIERGIAAGKVDMGGHDLRQEVDAGQAV